MSKIFKILKKPQENPKNLQNEETEKNIFAF